MDGMGVGRQLTVCVPPFSHRRRMAVSCALRSFLHALECPISVARRRLSANEIKFSAVGSVEVNQQTQTYYVTCSSMACSNSSRFSTFGHYLRTVAATPFIP